MVKVLLFQIKIMDEDFNADDDVDQVSFDAAKLKNGDNLFKTFVLKDVRPVIHIVLSQR